MLHSTRHSRGARAIFALRPSYSSLVHYMASTTIYGAPMKRGVVPSGSMAHVSAYWVDGSWLRCWRMSCTNSWSNLRHIPAPQAGFTVLRLPGLGMVFCIRIMESYLHFLFLVTLFGVTFLFLFSFSVWGFTHSLSFPCFFFCCIFFSGGYFLCTLVGVSCVRLPIRHRANQSTKYSLDRRIHE